MKEPVGRLQCCATEPLTILILVFFPKEIPAYRTHRAAAAGIGCASTRVHSWSWDFWIPRVRVRRCAMDIGRGRTRTFFTGIDPIKQSLMFYCSRGPGVLHRIDARTLAIMTMIIAAWNAWVTSTPWISSLLLTSYSASPFAFIRRKSRLHDCSVRHSGE